MKASFALLIASLFLALNSFSQSLTIATGAQQELVLNGSSCETLFKERQALCTWKQSLEPDFVAPPQNQTSCKASPDGSFSLKVLNCLPYFAQTYTKKKLVRHGPNCWGTAMSFHGLSKKPRFLWPEEMHYWMDSPVCRKLAVGEALEAGDVINVYYPEYVSEPGTSQKTAGTNFWQALYPARFTPLEEPTQRGYTGYDALLHSVTYISSQLAYGKDSPNKDDRFYFHSLNQVYGRPRDKECQENPLITPYLREYQQTPKGLRNSACRYFSLAYRCGNIPSYLAKQNLSIEEQAIQKRVAVLEQAQAALFPLILNLQTKVLPGEAKSIAAMAARTIEQDLIELKKPGVDKNLEMLLTLEYFTAAGLIKTLQQAEML
ncbi:MAG: hypothetical protein H7333_04835 [Bdellovibrionales bacterium]|nr:hypothetical protein [Oligoflexia bacterium]